ncbi:MAG: hypothetical protein II207_05015 [Clostridia bacterium]|nr:hypothetical protein [Clostridia bacterium]
MTYGEAAAWLGRGVRIRARIGDQLARIEKWRSLAESITQTLKDTPPSPSMPSKRIEKYAILIADAESEIEREVWALKCIESEIQAAIRNMSDPVYAEILTKRYLLGQTWDQIAYQMNYSTRWIMDLKIRAITEIARVNS